jgi:hypothetical protein
MAEETQRIAILLHGHSLAGKTTAGKLLFAGKEPVSLDAGPPYEGLRSDENVLVLDLGCGEDFPLRPESRPRATRNPQEWLRVLEEERRPLFAFFLTADWPAVEVRARAESSRNVTEQSARLSHELYRTHDEAVTFPAAAGISEHPIDTTRMTPDEVAAKIRNLVTKARPLQRWS